ncbi:MAG: DNA-directed DNA polymerase [Candidatus Aenigmatarchaeota archaeon]
MDHYDENGRTVVRLWCKDVNGKTVAVLDESFIPYLYIQPKPGAETKLQEIVIELSRKHADIGILKTEIVSRRIGAEEQRVLKVYTNLSSDLQKVRDMVKLLEAERGGPGTVIEEYQYAVSHSKRYPIEKGITPADWIEIEGKEEKSDEWQVDRIIRASSVKSAAHADAPPLKILAFDIENVEEAGRQKIIMLSMAGKDGFKKVITWQKAAFQSWVEVVKDEKSLLESFVKHVNAQDPDMLVGFMTDEHDFKLILQRAADLRVRLPLSRDGSAPRYARRVKVARARLRGRVHLDLFSWALTILAPHLQTEVMTLDSICAELLGDRKIPMEFEELLEAWQKKKDLAKLAAYSLKDSELCIKLNGMLMHQILALTRIVCQSPYDVSRMTYGQLSEWYMVKRALELNMIPPNQPKFDEILQRQRKPQYIGGYVRDPLPGLHEELAVLDFRSLYPSIIATFNISPETFGHCAKAEGWQVPDRKYWFCKKHRGFVSERASELIERRVELKKQLKGMKPGTVEWRELDNEQFGVKTITNATYGIMGYPGALWYCYECAESAAAFGRYWIKQVMSWAEEAGFTIIYGDTDSMFVKLNGKGKLEKNVTKFIENTNKKLPGMIEIDLQGFYRRGIFTPLEAGGAAKKRYALMDEKGKLTIRGLERVRGDWCELAKATQEEVLRLVLSKKDMKGAIETVKDAVSRLKSGKVPLRDLAIYESLAKPLSEYKVTAPNVVVAKKMIARGRPVGEGSVMIYVITKGKESISNRAEPIEDASLKDIDIKYYIEKQIVPPSYRVLAALGVKKEQLI